VAGALVLTRLIKGLLFQVSATDPPIFAGISLLFLAVAFAAIYVIGEPPDRFEALILGVVRTAAVACIGGTTLQFWAVFIAVLWLLRRVSFILDRRVRIRVAAQGWLVCIVAPLVWLSLILEHGQTSLHVVEFGSRNNIFGLSL
jgi:hypothetical protein